MKPWQAEDFVFSDSAYVHHTEELRKGLSKQAAIGGTESGQSEKVKGSLPGGTYFWNDAVFSAPARPSL